VRTNGLFKKMSPAENYHFLSGLLIGSELKDLNPDPPATIVLVSSGHLQAHYEKALRLLGLDQSLVIKNADKALLNGQWQLYKRAAKRM
jgi:2-dehydro-3-deoxygalactonokinase